MTWHDTYYGISDDIDFEWESESPVVGEGFWWVYPLFDMPVFAGGEWTIELYLEGGNVPLAEFLLPVGHDSDGVLTVDR